MRYRSRNTISFAWPADHVNSISTGYNGFSSCVYRFEGEHDEIVKLRFNKLLNGNRTCRSVSSPDFNRLLCVGSENFSVKVSLVPFSLQINFRLVRIRWLVNWKNFIYLRRFGRISIYENVFCIPFTWLYRRGFLVQIVCNSFSAFFYVSTIESAEPFQIFPFLDLFRDNNAARVPINLRNELWIGIAPFYICTTGDR